MFNNHQQKEVAILNTEKRWIHMVLCIELPGWHTPDATMHDELGIFHADRQQFIQNGMVQWLALCN